MNARAESIGPRRWPGHLAPAAGELLSSWAVRFSNQNGFRKPGFAKHFATDRNIFRHDIDVLASQELINELGSLSGYPSTLLNECTLTQFEGVLFTAADRPGWVLPLVERTGRSRPGLQFCPACLGDNPAFYRKTWRLGFSVVCPLHMTPLVDRCRCGAGVKLWGLRDITRACLTEHLVRCYRCGADLRYATATPVSRDLLVLCEALHFQTQCYRALNLGALEMPAGLIPAKDFFEDLYALVSMLSRGRVAMQLRSNTASWRGGYRYKPTFVRGRYRYEDLNTGDRLTMAAIVAEWLDDWPAAFIKTCSRAGVSPDTTKVLQQRFFGPRPSQRVA